MLAIMIVGAERALMVTDSLYTAVRFMERYAIQFNHIVTVGVYDTATGELLIYQA